MRSAWHAVIAEMAGTFLFFFVGIGAAGSIARLTPAGAAFDPAGLLVIALAHGLVLTVLVSSLGALSGGHFNPAVTAGVWLAGLLPSRRAASYVLAQLIGAILAAWALRAIFPADIFPQLGIPRLFEGIDPLQGLAIEAVLTIILVAAVFGTAIDSRGPKLGGLAIGLALAAGILMGGPLTGGALNPARWFGPAAVLGDWSNSAVWIVGPTIGAAIVALAYRFMFLPEANPEQASATPDA